MSKVVIRVENVSKQYKLGTITTGTLSHDLNRLWHRVRGKEDPYLKIGEVNDRTTKRNSDYVWALKDINFEVKQGEVLGIIGRNGAGKSTLLKILSRTTSPTTGVIKTRGRVASLLEVGTGFHPELTGRENIFLNGAILGMTRAEIKSKFDEIVDFSGVEKYIDTPVKRYSSGMYVRLAFAVAAHLEPEILIVDEVLAVGDAEFQKKCLGKMKDVSGQGRTVLFVSHNMAAIKGLCSTGIMLNNGYIDYVGDIYDLVNRYIKHSKESLSENGSVRWNENTAPGGDDAKILSIFLNDKAGCVQGEFSAQESIEINIEFLVYNNINNLRVGVQILTLDDLVAFVSSEIIDNATPGRYILKCNIPENLLSPINYALRIGIGIPGVRNLVEPSKYLIFSISDYIKKNQLLVENWPGVVRPHLKWVKEFHE